MLLLFFCFFLYCIHLTLTSMFIFLDSSSYVEINIRQHNITCKIEEPPSFHFLRKNLA